MITRRELFLGPLAALALKMAQRTLPAQTPKQTTVQLLPGMRPKREMYIAVDIAAGEDQTVLQVWENDKLVETVPLKRDRQIVYLPAGRCPRITLKVDSRPFTVYGARAQMGVDWA